MESEKNHLKTFEEQQNVYLLNILFYAIGIFFDVGDSIFYFILHSCPNSADHARHEAIIRHPNSLLANQKATAPAAESVLLFLSLAGLLSLECIPSHFVYLCEIYVCLCVFVWELLSSTGHHMLMGSCTIFRLLDMLDWVTRCIYILFCWKSARREISKTPNG